MTERPKQKVAFIAHGKEAAALALWGGLNGGEELLRETAKAAARQWDEAFAQSIAGTATTSAGENEPLTIEMMTNALDKIREDSNRLLWDRSKIERDIRQAMRVPDEMLMPPKSAGRFMGYPVIVSDLCTEHDGWNWKPSRYRSARVLKKLRKRFGTRERRKPCMFQIDALGRGPTYYMHPDIWDKLKKDSRPWT